MDDLETELRACAASALEYLSGRLERAGVFTTVARSDSGLLVRLKSSDRLKHLRLMSPSTDAINYEHDIAEQFEAKQPRCVIGSMDRPELTDEVLAAFKSGQAVWHTLPPGVPITRVAETVIALDWGMKVQGVFVLP